MQPPSLWMPELDTEVHQMLGKLGEESSELSTIVTRILIQGLSGVNPDTGQLNTHALRDEVADVEAMISVVRTLFADRDWPALDDPARRENKIRHKTEWLRMIREREKRDSPPAEKPATLCQRLANWWRGP